MKVQVICGYVIGKSECCKRLPLIQLIKIRKDCNMINDQSHENYLRLMLLCDRHQLF